MTPIRLFFVLLITFSGVISAAAQDGLSHYNNGISEYRAGNMEAAESALRKCVRLAPASAHLRRMLGRILANRKQLDEAEESFRFATQLEPRVSGHLLDFGSFLAAFRPERLDEALDVFRKAVELDPEARRTLAELPHLAYLRNHPRFRALIAPDTSNE